MTAVAERSGLIVTDVEVLRVHYAETLRHWRERFMARWDDAAKLYDERFCRMWEFYLAGTPPCPSRTGPGRSRRRRPTRPARCRG
jgi:cyclopropane-fatty-acyl-phospholipid synthase